VLCVVYFSFSFEISTKLNAAVNTFMCLEPFKFLKIFKYINIYFILGQCNPLFNIFFQIYLWFFCILVLVFFHLRGNFLPTEKYSSANIFFDYLKKFIFVSIWLNFTIKTETRKFCSISARHPTVWYVWFNREIFSAILIAVSSGLLFIITQYDLLYGLLLTVLYRV
jgi:hypothetical protein